MFPDARSEDKEMFSHFNLEFDLRKKQITAETAAKDYHGVPHYQFIYDTADQSSIEITNIGDWGTSEVSKNTKALVVEPVAKNTAEITADKEAMRLTLEE